MLDLFLASKYEHLFDRSADSSALKSDWGAVNSDLINAIEGHGQDVKTAKDYRRERLKKTMRWVRMLRRS